MSTYQQSAGDVLVPGSASVTELATSVGGFIASCGFAALAAVQHVVQGTPATSAQDTALTQQAVTEHQTVGKFAGSGQATPQNIKYVAGQHGIQFLDLTQEQALSVAGRTPEVVGVSNARAFGGDDSDVSGHYIAILGKTRQGNIIASDPNQRESTRGQLNVYTQQQLTLARPFWFGAPSASGAGSGAVVAPGGVGTPMLSLPGVGNLWTATTSALGNAADAINPLSGVAKAISDAAGALFSAAMVTFKRIGAFLLGVILVVIGLLVLFRRETAQGVSTYKQGAAAHAAAAAIVP